MEKYFNWKDKTQWNKYSSLPKEQCTPMSAMPKESQHWFDGTYALPLGMRWDYSYRDGKWPVQSGAPEIPVSERLYVVLETIDTEAGNARKKLVSSGDLIEEEYWIAYEESKKYLEALKNGDGDGLDVPLSVKAHADSEGVSPKEAATTICLMHDRWFLFTNKIREIRLMGKSAVKKAAKTNEKANLQDVAKPFIDQLRSMDAKE